MHEIKSGYKYVNWYPRGKKWTSRLLIGTSYMHLGHFEDLSVARNVQMQAQNLLDKSLELDITKETAMQEVLKAYRVNDAETKDLLKLAKKALNRGMYSLAYTAAKYAVDIGTL